MVLNHARLPIPPLRRGGGSIHHKTSMFDTLPAVQIRRTTRAKRLTLRLDQDGQLHLTAPKRVDDATIQQFIHSKQDWIARKQRTLEAQPWFGETRDELWLFGKVHTKTYGFDADSNAGVHVDAARQRIHINHLAPEHHPTHPKTHSAIQRFLKQTASQYFHKRVPVFAAKMDVSYKRLQFREQKTRWGSCSSTGTLSLNWRLVHTPPAVIDYLIVHELAHVRHPNHARDFWEFVAQFDAAFETHREWLRSRRLRRLTVKAK